MKRRSTPPIGVLLIILTLTISSNNAEENVIKPRWSCFHHYLAGIRTSAVLPVAGHYTPVPSNVQCLFENGHAYTEIHSALEKPYQVDGKKSVNFQIADLYHLREMVRRSQCTQTLTVEWKKKPEYGRGSLTVVSLLNMTTRVDYNEVLRQDFLLEDSMAGIRHIIPDVDDDVESNPFVSTTRLLCKHTPPPECLFHGRIEVDLEANLEWTYTFAFRTDSTNRTLLSLRAANGAQPLEVRLENDYFLRVAGSHPHSVGHLSDATWHTVVVRHSEPDRHFLEIDNISPPIELVSRELNDENDKTITLIVDVDGDIRMIDPTDTSDDCLVSFGQHRRRLQENAITRSMCEGCGCAILPAQFDGLSRCVSDEDDESSAAFSLRRDLDRLSFIHVDDAFETSPTTGAAIPAISVTFKSDSDAGLVLFGHWQNSLAKGRTQVHYTHDTMHATYCQQHGDEQETCTSCSIRVLRGFNRDTWHQTTLWGGGDEMHLAVDTSICRLAHHNGSLAEVYGAPRLVHKSESAVFVGGVWNEKKRNGLYRADVEHKYFENTREKAPGLRGCVKDVYVKGTRMDLGAVFENQKREMLIEPNDGNAFAVRSGCDTCNPECDSDVRCRFRGPLQSSPMLCDCADVLQFNNSDGICESKFDSTPVVLSTSFLSQTPIILDVHNTKAILSKVWLKFALPEHIAQSQTIFEFNSHRETIFNIRIDSDGTVNVVFNGHDDDKNAAKTLSLLDDRVHLLQLERRTPIGTRHSAKKYDLFIDGWHTVVSDIHKMTLSNITVNSADTEDESTSIIIHDFGLAYEYDEHGAVLSPSNVIHQLDMHSQLLPYQVRTPILAKCGMLDTSLWHASTDGSDAFESSPRGQIVDFTADIIEPEQLLSARWILYSLFLTILLCLLILVCIVCYWCVIRKRSLQRDECGSQRTIMRDSPDYAPVKMRDDHLDGISMDEDGSIGTDDTDLQAYRDIPSHRVKIYRESMVSILVPSIDQPAEAAIVKRNSTSSEQFVARPSPNTDAPLVKVNDD